MTKKSSTTNNITVFLGDSLDDPNEERFLNTLCRDLASRQIPAIIFANFQAGRRRNQRQVDFFVVTPFRAAILELKTVDQAAWVDGPLNGPWVQHFEGDITKTLGRNPNEQARQAAYAISDVVRGLMKADDLPKLGTDFFRQIDKLVVLSTDIPAGSQIVRDAYVTTVGCSVLLDLLGTNGSRPAWSDGDWETLARGLSLYRQADDSPEARRQLAAREALAEYRFRLGAHLDAGAQPPVPLTIAKIVPGVGKEQPREEPASFEDLVAATAMPGRIVVEAGGGAGKTLLAQGLAAELTRGGALVVVAPCGEYERGHLGRLLARAAAPFSTEPVGDLLAHAGRVGDRSVVILDGLNEADPADRDDLLGAARGYTTRFANCSVLITSNVAVTPEGPSVTFTIAPPDATQRDAILRAHGAGDPERIPQIFTTPFQLSIAAACAAELDPSATVADLYAEFVGRLCPSEVTRNALRALALAMIAEMRTSMRVRHVADLLGSASALGLDPSAVDEVLASPLLVVQGGRVRFIHELLERHLAAEALVCRAHDADELLQALRAPGHGELSHSALSQVRDPETRAAVLAGLADYKLYAAAAHGELGPRAQADAAAAIRGALADAAFALESATLTAEPPEQPFCWAEWEVATPRTANEQALLVAAAELVAEGLFVDEVCSLLDRTDARVLAEVRARRAVGDQRPITTLLSGTTLLRGTDYTSTIGTTVVLGSLHLTFGRRSAPGVADRVFTGATNTSWCRLHLAASLMRGATSGDELIPALVRLAWDAQGYHLRIHVLEMLPFAMSALTDEGKAMLAKVLESILEATDPREYAYNGLLFEALDACGHLGYQAPDATAVAEWIRTEMLAPDPTDEVCLAAHGACSSQWENASLVGDYCGAIHDVLDDAERLELYTRAARAKDPMDPSWVMQELCRAVPTGDAARDAQLREIFADIATGPPRAGVMPHEQLDAHVYSVRGLARLGAPIPPCAADAAPEVRAWSIVDGLVASLENATIDPEPLWDELMATAPAEVIGIVFALRRAGSMLDTDHRRESAVLARLLRRDPDRFRDLFLWGIEHRIQPRVEAFEGDTPTGFMIRELGDLGDATTVALLEPYLAEPPFARDAVEAIRRLNAQR